MRKFYHTQKRFYTLLFYPILYLLSALLSGILYIRHFLYDKKIFKSYHFSNVYSICIGNLNLGGTGKSPLTDYLIELLKVNYTLAVLSRGYGRKTKGFKVVNVSDNYWECGDEPLMYKTKHSDIVVTVCEDRVEGIKKILQLYPDIQIILLDDAFQHRRIIADLNILLTEYYQPFFEDDVFPLGKLRDIKSHALRADMLIFSKVPENTSQNDIQNKIICSRKFYDKDVFFSTIEYQELYSITNFQKINIYKELSKYSCILVTGIANSTPLSSLIKEYANYFYHFNYPDHYAFSKDNLELIKNVYQAWQEKYSNTIIITTEKDAVRMKAFIPSFFNLPIFVIPIEIQLQKFSPSFNDKMLYYVTTNTRNKQIHS